MSVVFIPDSKCRVTCCLRYLSWVQVPRINPALPAAAIGHSRLVLDRVYGFAQQTCRNPIAYTQRVSVLLVASSYRGLALARFITVARSHDSRCHVWPISLMQVLNSDEGESLQCLNFSITKTVKANMELGSLVVVDIFIRVRCSMTNRTQGKYHVRYFVLAENLSPFQLPCTLHSHHLNVFNYNSTIN